jgi:hypothetical protein
MEENTKNKTKKILYLISFSIIIHTMFKLTICLSDYANLSEWNLFFILDIILLLSILCTMIVMLESVLIPLSIIGMLFKKIRFISLTVFVFTTIGIFSFFVVPHQYFSKQIYTYAIGKFADRSEALIKAINMYKKKYRHPPEKLKDLVPEFLSDVPNTGFGNHSEYHYILINYPNNTEKRFWELSVYYPLYFMTVCEIYYDPEKQDRLFIESRIKDWTLFCSD